MVFKYPVALWDPRDRHWDDLLLFLYSLAERRYLYVCN